MYHRECDEDIREDIYSSCAQGAHRQTSNKNASGTCDTEKDGSGRGTCAAPTTVRIQSILPGGDNI